MYSPFLWRNAKGQSHIIKRRWWRRLSKMLQICLQGTKLIKHVHQYLTMSRLNDHDSLQHTSNVWIIQGKRWRNSRNSRINKLLSCSITCRRGRRRCDTRRLNPRTFRAISHLSSPLPKKGGTYKSDNMEKLRSGKLI